MQEIQKLLDAQIQKMPVLILASMVQEKFAAQGYSISERASERIALKITSGGGDGFVWTRDFWRPPKITFGDDDVADLEKRLEAVLESRNVHASAAAAYDRLGVFPETKTALSGPSNAGLADPGHATALALIHVNMALLPFFGTADSVVFGKVMMRIADEIGDLLLAAHRALEEDERRYRPSETAPQQT